MKKDKNIEPKKAPQLEFNFSIPENVSSDNSCKVIKMSDYKEAKRREVRRYIIENTKSF